MLEMLNEIVQDYGLRMSKQELAIKVEHAICREYEAYVLNDKYLIVNGENYQFIKTKHGWVVKPW